MFRQDAESSSNRVLIASGNMDDRRFVGDIAKAAGLRAVGFVREAELVHSRTRLSMPDVLLLDVELLRLMKSESNPVQDLQGDGSLQTVLFGHKISNHLVAQWKRDGFHGVLDLESPLANEVDSSARLLRLALSNKQAAAPPPATTTAAQSPRLHSAANSKRKILPADCVVIGSSTGGPVALMKMLKQLPAKFPLPIAVVQHMPPSFTRMLAERLNAECSIEVLEAESGMMFEPGRVLIAPGGFHMVIEGDAKAPQVRLHTQAPENSCRPAVDVLFRSSAKVYGGSQHVIVLTGMGRDGLAGATQLHGLGARVVVQDAATSTVWGMPGAIAQAGYADQVLSIDEIAPELMRCLQCRY